MGQIHMCPQGNILDIQLVYLFLNRLQTAHSISSTATDTSLKPALCLKAHRQTIVRKQVYFCGEHCHLVHNCSYFVPGTLLRGDAVELLIPPVF